MASKRKYLHETDDEFSDPEIESKSKSANVNKSAKRKQPYREKYSEKYPCMKRGSDEYKVFCTICASEFGCMYGGMDDVNRHIHGPKHLKKEASLESLKKMEKSNQKLTGFFPKLSQSQVSNHELDVIRAETTIVDLVVELNLPMASLDKFNKVFTKIFPDSKIAKDYKCARSKGTAIVKEMSAKITLTLGERMKRLPFTISTDGSNDKGGTKLFPLVVRTVDPDTMEVRSDALSVPSIDGSATGVKIFSLIKNEMEVHNIPWDNCLALGCDNANVMVGKDSGVYGCMLKEQPKLYLSGCVCHLIHIAAEKGAGSLPFSPSQLLVDVYYYLEKSSKRQEALRCFQVLHEIEEHKILKHVSTRWLSIGKCLPRLIDSWHALYDFFKDEGKNATTSALKKKTGDLKQIFISPTNLLYCMFLADAISLFEKINTELQSDKPMVHVLKNKMERFLRDLLIRFVKPSAMQYKCAVDVDFTTPVNIQSNENLIIGEQARTFVENPRENHLKSERIQEFYVSVVKFFQASCNYIKKKLPLSDPLLKHIQVVDPEKQLDSSLSFQDLDYFLKRFPKLVAPGVTTTDIRLEFSKYQCADIRQCLKERVDATWWAVGQLQEDRQPMFQHLPMVMLSILTIPHSSAHCERIFSLVRKNKTEFRGSMLKDTLEALVVAKSRPGEALERRYSTKDLHDMKSAYYRSLQKTK